MSWHYLLDLVTLMELLGETILLLH